MFPARVSRKHGRRQRPGRKSFSLNRADGRMSREHESRKVEWTCRARSHNLAQYNRNHNRKHSGRGSPVIRRDHQPGRVKRRAIMVAAEVKAKARSRKGQ